jgi:modulator of FtsH protease HflK
LATPEELRAFGPHPGFEAGNERRDAGAANGKAFVSGLAADLALDIEDRVDALDALRSDAERAQNEAQTYANRVVPESRGRAAQVTQAAEAYRQQTVAEATGQSARFLKIYEEYKKAPEVTRQRMYLETMERVFGGTDKIIIDSGTQNSVVPYLPLTELTRRPPAQPQNPPQNPPQAGGNR